MRIRTTAAAVLVAAAGTLALGGVAHAQTEARQVSPVPRGGVDTGLDIGRPVGSKPAPPVILLVAAFAVAGTAAAGAAAAARVA